MTCLGSRVGWETTRNSYLQCLAISAEL